MGGGSEEHAGESERRQGQPRSHETHFDGSTKEHDGAARALAVKQRRAGSRFRYRRRRQSAHHLRLAQDAHLRAFFLAAFWISLVAAGASTIGTIALGTDTGSDWTSVQTAGLREPVHSDDFQLYFAYPATQLVSSRFYHSNS